MASELKADDAQVEQAAKATHMEFPAVIAKALVALQADVKAIEKTAENGHFKNTYAPLDAVMDFALPLLSKNKLALSQWPTTMDGKHYLHTVLMHEDGSMVQSDLELLLTKQDPQGLGSALTYEKRQTVMAILGISAKDEDDDGNKASGNQEPATQEQLDEIASLCRMLKFPPEEVEKKLRTLRTADRAILALADLDKIIAGRASAVKAAKATENAETHVDVVDDEGQSNASMEAVAKRLSSLGLKDDGTIRDLIRKWTKKPFLKSCKPDDLKVLSDLLDRIDSGETVLPEDWYAAGHAPTKAAADDTEEGDDKEEQS